MSSTGTKFEERKLVALDVAIGYKNFQIYPSAVVKALTSDTPAVV